MSGPFEPPDPPERQDEGDVEYNLPFALNLARLWKAGKLIGGDPYAVVAALLQQIEKDHVIGGGGQIDPIGTGTPMPPEMAAQADDGEDILVSFGDMRDFTMDVLKKIMGGGLDNNHESMVEEHIKVFNYAVTQGIHPGQALLACIQAIGSLIGFAIRSGMHPNVAAAMTALIIKTTQQAATQVQIVTTN